MGLAIILRSQAAANHFRNLVLAAVNSRAGGRALMCSGFFQELFKKHPYRASMEGNLAKNLASKRVALTTVGIHNNTWMPAYRNFAKNLKRHRVSLNAIYVNQLRWHAKVFILSTAKQPVFGIIGSSNITRRAFSVGTPFNREADVVLWDDGNSRICRAVAGVLDEIQDPHQVVRAHYPTELNQGLSEADRLRDLEREILSTPHKPLSY